MVKSEEQPPAHTDDTRRPLEGEGEDDEDVVGRLSQDTLKYFQRVEQVLDDNVFEDEDHKTTFLHNVFNEMQTDGTHLSRHSRKASTIIEKIIPCLDSVLFARFVELVEAEMEHLSCDRFASHVVETLCKSSVRHVDDEAACKVFVKFCKVLRGKCSELMRNTWGSHVISTVLQVLSGVAVPDSITRSKASRNAKKKKKKYAHKFKGSSDVFEQQNENKVATVEPVLTEVPHSFKKCFKKYIEVIQDDINFGELLCHRNASPVLQVLLHTTALVSEKNFLSLYKSIVTRGKLLEPPQDGGGLEDDKEFAYRLPVVFTDEIGSHLFEAVIRSAKEEQLIELGELCFKRCILTTSVHPLGNYLVQTFLRCVKSDEHVEFFIAHLLAHVEDILAAGCLSVVVRVAELINKHTKVEYQKKLIKTLADALHIPQDCTHKPLSKLIACMKTYDVVYTKETDTSTPDTDKEGAKEESETQKKVDNTSKDTEVVTETSINYHGSCLLTNLLSFKKSKLVVESFLELSDVELKVLACHQNGSFAVETFFQSEWIPSKSKFALGEKFMRQLEHLAANKYGSRIVDALYKSVDEGMQERVKFRLRKHKSALESDMYGRIVLYNCGVKQHVEKMKELEARQEKKRKLFEEIISEEKTTKPLTTTTTTENVVPKKKKKDDRAEKYRKQLEALGITYNNNDATPPVDTSVVGMKEEEEEVKNVLQPTVNDDLSDVLLAIEASVTVKGTKKKQKELRRSK